MNKFIYFLLGVLSLFSNIAQAQDPTTYIHPRAIPLIPTIQTEINKVFPELETPWYIPGLIEHESCVYLKAAKCWRSDSELRKTREQGVGLGQVTRTWKNGQIRFDTLADLKRAYPKHLGELSWDTVKSRPDLQIRAIVVMSKECYRKLSNVRTPLERLKMCDSAYNGGLTNITRSRTVCGLSKNCDPQQWFDNVEKYNQKSDQILYDTRSAKSINNHHVRDVFLTRMHKFQPYF